MKTQARTRGKRCLLPLLTFFLAAFSASAHAQENRVADEAALRENVKQMENGWNTKSGALFAQPFAEDADYVVINGMHIKGRATIATAHQRIFDTVFKDTSIKLAVKQVRFLRPDVAVVHVTGQRVGATNELMHSATITLIMTKEKQAWTIAAFQNTAIETGSSNEKK